MSCIDFDFEHSEQNFEIMPYVTIIQNSQYQVPTPPIMMPGMLGGTRL